MKGRTWAWVQNKKWPGHPESLKLGYYTRPRDHPGTAGEKLKGCPGVTEKEGPRPSIREQKTRKRKERKVDGEEGAPGRTKKKGNRQEERFPG